MTNHFLSGKSGMISCKSFEKEIEDRLKEWAYKTFDAFFVHSQVPVVGSVLYCNLAVALEHSGIYVGNNRVVHLNGNGIVEVVSFQEFIARLDGNNPAFSVFCAVDANGDSIGSNRIAERALSLVGKQRNYNLVLDNCHRFTSYCLTGKDCACTTFTGLEEMLKKKYSFQIWKAINLS